VAVEIQAVTSEWLNSWYGVGYPRVSSYPYNFSPTLRLNSGLTLESALLFNLPQYQPDGFYQREIRRNQTSCVAPILNTGNSINYLDDFPNKIGNYLQAGMEAMLNGNNGVADANRGASDIISILIRRGREMGVPSFTDVREAISQSPSGCPWDTWTGVGDCNPAKLFKASALASLTILYATPGDVELIVGSLLSVDTPANKVLSNSGIDQTQAYLLFGEIDRILNLDYFGVNFVTMHADTFLSRFQNDDPVSFNDFAIISAHPDKFPLALPYTVAQLITTAATTGQKIIQANSQVKCVASGVFSQSGYNTLNSPTFQFNTYNLPYTDSRADGGAQNNCDIPGPVFSQPVPGLGGSYDSVFCFFEPPNTDCWRPSLPFCV